MNDLSPFGFVDDGRGDISTDLDLPPTGNWMFGVETENL